MIWTIISRQERLACVLSTGTDISIYYDPLKPKGGSGILKWGVNFCNNVREIKYYFNIWGIRKKERRGPRKRGLKIHPFHLLWIRAWSRLRISRFSHGSGASLKVRWCIGNLGSQTRGARDFQAFSASVCLSPWCGAKNADSQNGWKSSLTQGRTRMKRAGLLVEPLRDSKCAFGSSYDVQP